MKIRPVGAKLFDADRATDTTKVVVAFRNFANAPENTFKHIIIIRLPNSDTVKFIAKRIKRQ